MNRVTFLVDGFNLYHSVKAASEVLGLDGKGTKWLNIYSMCSSCLSLIGGNAQIEEIYYFSALADHLEDTHPNTTLRHLTYIEALKSTGVIIELSRFKAKTIRCEHCNNFFTRHEEKETDVAIGAKLIEVFILNKCDTAVVVTGDTDIKPAVKIASSLTPKKNIWFAFPFARTNRELKKIVAPNYFRIKKERYITHQFADPVLVKDGKKINKPSEW